jgi:hypothetical protein
MRSQTRDRAAETTEIAETEEQRAETTVADGAIMTMTSCCDDRKLPIPANCNVPTAPTRAIGLSYFYGWFLVSSALYIATILSNSQILLRISSIKYFPGQQSHS